MGSFSSKDREFAYRMQNGRCFNCHKELDNDYEVHAVIPGKHGTVHNAIVLCHECHTNTLTYGKGEKGLTDFYL
jgi:uncharacterized CHY-type Zn-finger protein